MEKCMVSLLFGSLIIVFCGQALAGQDTAPKNHQLSANKIKGEQTAEVLTADLATCLDIAMKNNHRRPASRYAVVMAEARHQQALAAYWPQVSVEAGYQLRDEDPNFIFPSNSFSIPMGGTLAITLPNGYTVQTNSITIPEQNVKLMDKETWAASVNGTWLLYDGGSRKGMSDQAKSYVDLMKQEQRRTDLELTDSVKRLYYGAVLADTLYKLGHDTLERMQATLDLTQTMYKQGSGKVKKTDWLENKIMVESIRSTTALLEKNKLAARAALANTMGMDWQSSVIPADKALPFDPVKADLNMLVSDAYRFSPDWGKIEAAIDAAQGGITEARSGFFPKIALTGKLQKWWNDYDGGMATDINKEGWTVGVGMEIPVFSGFLTKGKLSRAKAALAKIKEEQILLGQGIGLRVKDIFLGLQASEKSYDATLEAMKAAAENTSLNTRAYQYGMVETEKVIRAQLVESLVSARHYKASYDHLALTSQLEFAVGRQIMNIIEE